MIPPRCTALHKDLISPALEWLLFKSPDNLDFIWGHHNLGPLTESFTIIRKAEYDPIHTSQSLCLQVPLLPLQEVPQEGYTWLMSLWACLAAHLWHWRYSVLWLWASDRSLLKELYCHFLSWSFFFLCPHFVEIWAWPSLRTMSELVRPLSCFWQLCVAVRDSSLLQPWNKILIWKFEY